MSGKGAPPPRRFTRVQLTDAALADLRGIAERAQPVLENVFRVLKGLDAGHVKPTPLNDYGKTGDLTDCGKIVVETDGFPEHRIVVRSVAGTVEVHEVVCVEERAEDLAYLLAGLRLGRINDPVRKSDTQRRIARIKKLRDQAAKPPGEEERPT